jgi:hypothetical protein
MSASQDSDDAVTVFELHEGAVQRVRIDLMKGATHWAEVIAQYDPLAASGPAEAAAGAAASMAHNYAYVLAALLGQMAASGDDDRWTAEEAAEFVYDLLANGDCDDLNADVTLPAQTEGEVSA